MVYTNLLCDCCCTVAVRTRNTNKAYTHTSSPNMHSSGPHTLSNSVRSCKQQQADQEKKVIQMWGSSTQTCGVAAHRPALTYTRAHVPQHTNNRHRYHIVTGCAGGNMEHGLLHATHSSCWCCCCGSALLLVEAEVLLLQLLLCPSKACTKQSKTWGLKNWPCLTILQQQTEPKAKSRKMKTCEVWIFLHSKHEHARAREHSSTSTRALEHDHEHESTSTSTGA